jgi:predicted Rossmann fold nucleotide-binding protein DprA/Smf involved in DNA uptake
VAEEIAVRLDIPVDRGLAALLELELAGWVKRLPGSAYGR